MFDINLLRNDFENTISKLKNRNYDVSQLNDILLLDKQLRENITKKEDLNNKRNNLSSQISVLIKENKDDEVKKIKQQVLDIKDEIDKLETITNKLSNDINTILINIPNIYDDSVIIGKDENDNKEIKKFLEPTKFDFQPKSHWELGEKRKLFLADIATKLTGSRFVTYYDKGARLYRALIQFTLDHNIKNGFIEVLPQEIINDTSLFSTGQLPKFKDDAFKLEGMNYYLSPTAEVQLTNMFRDTIINKDQLPIKVTANTSCFRSEAGSAGKDTKGVIRLHQFHKSELVIISEPSKSFENLELMTSYAESILETLELPYRRILLCTGDMGFSSAKTYDIEVWMPSYNAYKEISSCSNCIDFQARRAKIRYKDENNKNQLVHTLNGSSLAIDRLWAAVVENCQLENGDIKIPKALRKYLDNKEVL